MNDWFFQASNFGHYRTWSGSTDSGSYDATYRITGLPRDDDAEFGGRTLEELHDLVQRGELGGSQDGAV